MNASKVGWANLANEGVFLRHTFSSSLTFVLWEVEAKVVVEVSFDIVPHLMRKLTEKTHLALSSAKLWFP